MRILLPPGGTSNRAYRKTAPKKRKSGNFFFVKRDMNTVEIQIKLDNFT